MEIVENCHCFLVITSLYLCTVTSRIKRFLEEGKYVKLNTRACLKEPLSSPFTNSMFVEKAIEFKPITISNTLELDKFKSEAREIILIGCNLDIDMIVYKKIIQRKKTNKSDEDGDSANGQKKKTDNSKDVTNSPSTSVV